MQPATGPRLRGRSPPRGPQGGRCRPRDWGPGGGGEPGRGSRGRRRRGAGVRSTPSPRLPPPRGAGGTGAESAQPGRWMNVGENGDQDDRVRLGHVGGADGGKSGPPHPLSSPTRAPGGNLRPPPHKAGPKLEAPEGQERGVPSSPSLSLPSLRFGGQRGRLNSALEDVCSSFHRPAALDSLSGGASPLHLLAPAGLPTPFSSAPLCFPLHVRAPGFGPLPSQALESPTVHTRKWREGNRAPSSPSPGPEPPHLEEAAVLRCRDAARVGVPWFRGC